jgi:hypothetical protein
VRDKCLAAIFLIGLVAYFAWSVAIVTTDRPIDYYTYLIAAYALSHGINIYLAPSAVYNRIAIELGILEWASPGYLYQLPTAMMVLPLTFVPLRIGAFVWVFTNGVAALASGVLLGMGMGSAWKKRLMLLGTIPFAPILTTMSLGQANCFVLLLTVGALRLWDRRREALGGALLAVGVWIKPLAAAILGLLAWRGRLRSLLGAVTASAVIVAAGAFVFGLEPSLTQFEPYRYIFQTSSSLSPDILTVQSPENQNLLGMITRWLTPHEYGAPLLNAPNLALPIYWGSVGVLALVTIALLWPFGKRIARFRMEVGLLIMTTLLASPVTELHHLTISVIAFAILVEGWKDWARLNLSTVAVTIAYLSMNVQGFLLHERFTGPTVLVDFATWGEIILWLVLAVEIHSQSRNSGGGNQLGNLQNHCMGLLQLPFTSQNAAVRDGYACSS